MQKKEEVLRCSSRLRSHLTEIPRCDTPLSANCFPTSSSTASPTFLPQKGSDTKCHGEEKTKQTEDCQWSKSVLSALRHLVPLQESGEHTTPRNDRRAPVRRKPTAKNREQPRFRRLRLSSGHGTEEAPKGERTTGEHPSMQNGYRMHPLQVMQNASETPNETGGAEKEHALRSDGHHTDVEEEGPMEWGWTDNGTPESHKSAPIPTLLPSPPCGTGASGVVSLADAWKTVRKEKESLEEHQEERRTAGAKAVMEEEWEDVEALGMSVSVHVIGEEKAYFPSVLPTNRSHPPFSAVHQTKAMPPSFTSDRAGYPFSLPSSSRDVSDVERDGKDPIHVMTIPKETIEKEEKKKKDDTNESDSSIPEEESEKDERDDTKSWDAAVKDALLPPLTVPSPPPLARSPPPRAASASPVPHASSPCSSSSASCPSLSLLLHLFRSLRERYSPITPPPLAFANVSPFVRVLCECYTPTGYGWGRVRVQRSPVMEGAVVVEVPGDTELRAISWWLGRTMKEAELDHYYGRVGGETGGRSDGMVNDGWGHGGRGIGIGWGEEEEGFHRTGGGRGGAMRSMGAGVGMTRCRYLFATTAAASDALGGGLTSCQWPSPSPVSGGDAGGMEAAFGVGAGGTFEYDEMRGSSGVVGGRSSRSTSGDLGGSRGNGWSMGSSVFSSFAYCERPFPYHPYTAHGMLPTDDGMQAKEEDEADDIFFSRCGWGAAGLQPISSSSPRVLETTDTTEEEEEEAVGSASRGERWPRPRGTPKKAWERDGRQGQEDSGPTACVMAVMPTPTPSTREQEEHSALSRLRSVSPATARRLRRQRTREAYPSRMVHLICVGHERAKAMLAASSLSMMRSLRISKIELSLDYPPMLHQHGNILWNRYMQLSKLELIATNCVGWSGVPCSSTSPPPPPLLPPTTPALPLLRPTMVRPPLSRGERWTEGEDALPRPSPSLRRERLSPPPTDTPSLTSIATRPTDRPSPAGPLHRKGRLWGQEGGDEQEGDASTFLYPADSDPLRSPSQWRVLPTSHAPSHQRTPHAASMTTVSTTSSAGAGTFVPSGEKMASRSTSLLYSSSDAFGGKGNGGALRGLERLPLLRELNLSNSLLDGVGFLGKSKTLSTLNLSNTSISNSGLQGLQECMSLKVLILFQCPSITSVKYLTPLYHAPTNDRVPSLFSASGSSGTATLLSGGWGSRGEASRRYLPFSPTRPASDSPGGDRGSESEGAKGEARGGEEKKLIPPPPPMNIEMLDLRGTSVNSQGLMGLGLLPRLRSLRLGRTKVTHLSPALAHAPALTYLDLENCTTLHPEEGLEGLFLEDGSGGPPGKKHHTPLKYLNLTRANVSSLAPLANARTLQCVIASRIISLAGRLLPEMFFTDAFGGSCLWSLTHFDLSHSPVDASHCMEVLIQCVNLQYVNLTRTQNLTCVDGLEQLQCLREVHLSHTAITSVNCFGKGAAPSLTHLNVSHTLLEDGGIRGLPYAPRLTLLDLTDTQICHVGHLHACPSLKVLVLSSTLVSSSGLRGLEQSLTLEELYLNEALVKHFTTWDVEASAICPLRYAAPSRWLEEMKMTEEEEEDKDTEDEEAEEAAAHEEMEEAAAHEEMEEEKEKAEGWWRRKERGERGGRRGLERPRPRGWPMRRIGCPKGKPRERGPLRRRLVPQEDVEGIADAEEGEEDESPAMQDARREAQLQQLWEVVESVARRYMSLRVAHSPASSFAFSSPRGSSASLPEADDVPQREAVGEYRSCGRKESRENHHNDNDNDPSSRMQRPPRDRRAEPLPSTPLYVLLSHLREWMLEKVMEKEDPQEAVPPVPFSVDNGKEEAEGTPRHERQDGRWCGGLGKVSPRHGGSPFLAEEDGKPRGSDREVATDPRLSDETPEAPPWWSGALPAYPHTPSSPTTTTTTTTAKRRKRPHKNRSHHRKSASPWGAESTAATDKKTPRLPPCSTIFYPSLWKLSISHTPHRSSGLIGILQLPRLVELDVSDTWIDSPVGLLLPFSAAVMESQAMDMSAWGEEDGPRETEPRTSARSAPRTEAKARGTDSDGRGPTSGEKRTDLTQAIPVDQAAATLSSPVWRTPAFTTAHTSPVTSIPPLSQTAPLWWEVLQLCRQYPHCGSFLLHQRLRCLILTDAKLQQTQFLQGVEYGQVLTYISVQSCQPSLSLMLGPSSMASLAACHSLVTLDMSHTDLTSKEMWYVQQKRTSTPSSPVAPSLHGNASTTAHSTRSKPWDVGRSTDTSVVCRSSDTRRAMTAKTTRRTNVTTRSIDTLTASSPSPSPSSSSCGIAVSTSSSSPFSSCRVEGGEVGQERQRWGTSSTGTVDRPRQDRYRERSAVLLHPSHTLAEEEADRRCWITSSAAPQGEEVDKGDERDPKRGKKSASSLRCSRGRTLSSSVDSSRPSTALHRKPTGKKSEEDCLKSSVCFSSLDENISSTQDVSTPHTTSTSIASLHLSGTILSDLSFLCFHRHVRVLQLSVTVVRDLSPLRYCHDLHLLDVSKTRVFDLRPLAPCKSLRYLFASDTFTTQTGIQLLPSLYHLEVVDLSGTPITSILLLRPLSQLRHLRIKNTAVAKAESKCFPPCTLIQQ